MRAALVAIALAPFLGGCAAAHALTCAELPGRAVPVMHDRHHLAFVDARHVAYDSIPPTSGPHIAFTVAPGPYADPIPDELQVHALEHGHVLIQYAPSLPASQRREVEHLARRHLDAVLVAPYPRLRAGIALTAWGRIDRMGRYDQTRVEAFVAALSGRYVHGWKHGAHECR